jgi:penicillin amidase
MCGLARSRKTGLVLFDVKQEDAGMSPKLVCALVLLLMAGRDSTACAGGEGPKRSAAPAAYGTIEILRDEWGIPHVFADTDEGAMYGLGYATAEERGFQMTYARRIMQGRLAETIGPRRHTARRETAVDLDRKMRTFGWARAAQRIASELDRETQALLLAYSAGVNAGFADQETDDRLHPLFRELGVAVEPWAPEDCLLSWWHLAQFFATDGTRDLIAWRNRDGESGRVPPEPTDLWVDDAVSVVRRSDVTEDWVEQVRQFAVSVGGSAAPGAAPGDGPRFSHAWVVGGSKVEGKSAVLVSDPQTPVRNPPLWMEFHIKGKTLNARGIGVPGSPGLLVGFNAAVAWGLTALGADQADLFRLETDGARPDHYRWNGAWRRMSVRREEIVVRDNPSATVTVRETHFGPVVSDFAFRLEGEPEVALKRVPLCESGRDTIQAVFAMMRASDAAEFLEASAGWRFPSANCVLGDAAGRIGFTVLGAIPIRPGGAARSGSQALRGQGDDDDWVGFIPAHLLPRVLDPRQGYLLSANHRPIETFYPLSLGISTGSMGDTIRSWRLRERLAPVQQFDPKEVLDVHFDSVNPARREIVRLGRHLRDHGGLSEAAASALQVLEPWLDAGASSDLRQAGAAVATRISTFFRFVNTPLAARYGGGESGLARFLKDAARRLDQGAPQFTEDERGYIDGLLAAAFDGAGESSRDGRGRAEAQRRMLGWFDSLDGFGSLGREWDLQSPSLNCVDGQTLHSQAAQSYTQWVPLRDPDAAVSICPIGHSDRPDSPYRTSTMALWGEARLHPAPLSRAAVERIARTRLSLHAAP